MIKNSQIRRYNDIAGILISSERRIDDLLDLREILKREACLLISQCNGLYGSLNEIGLINKYCDLDSIYEANKTLRDSMHTYKKIIELKVMEIAELIQAEKANSVERIVKLDEGPEND